MNRYELEQELRRIAPPRKIPPESHKRELEDRLRAGMITRPTPEPLTVGGYLALGAGLLATCLVISFALQPRQALPHIAFPVYRGDDLNQQAHMVIPVVPLSYEWKPEGLSQSREQLRLRGELLREVEESMVF